MNVQNAAIGVGVLSVAGLAGKKYCKSKSKPIKKDEDSDDCFTRAINGDMSADEMFSNETIMIAGGCILGALIVLGIIIYCLCCGQDEPEMWDRRIGPKNPPVVHDGGDFSGRSQIPQETDGQLGEAFASRSGVSKTGQSGRSRLSVSACNPAASVSGRSRSGSRLSVSRSGRSSRSKPEISLGSRSGSRLSLSPSGISHSGRSRSKSRSGISRSGSKMSCLAPVPVSVSGSHSGSKSGSKFTITKSHISAESPRHEQSRDAFNRSKEYLSKINEKSRSRRNGLRV